MKVLHRRTRLLCSDDSHGKEQECRNCGREQRSNRLHASRISRPAKAVFTRRNGVVKSCIHDRLAIIRPRTGKPRILGMTGSPGKRRLPTNNLVAITATAVLLLTAVLFWLQYRSLQQLRAKTRIVARDPVRAC